MVIVYYTSTQIVQFQQNSCNDCIFSYVLFLKKNVLITVAEFYSIVYNRITVIALLQKYCLILLHFNWFYHYRNICLVCCTHFNTMKPMSEYVKMYNTFLERRRKLKSRIYFIIEEAS